MAVSRFPLPGLLLHLREEIVSRQARVHGGIGGRLLKPRPRFFRAALLHENPPEVDKKLSRVGAGRSITERLDKVMVSRINTAIPRLPVPAPILIEFIEAGRVLHLKGPTFDSPFHADCGQAVALISKTAGHVQLCVKLPCHIAEHRIAHIGIPKTCVGLAEHTVPQIN